MSTWRLATRLLLAAAALIVHPSAFAQSNSEAFVFGTSVHLRTGPGPIFASLGTVWIGTKVFISERQAGWVKVELSFLDHQLHGWIREDLLVSEQVSKYWIKEKLTQLPQSDFEERQRLAERLIALGSTNGEGVTTDDDEVLARILEERGRPEAAAKVRENGFGGVWSDMPYFDRKKNPADRRAHRILAMPEVILRQAPSLKAVPVPFHGRPLKLGKGEQAQVIAMQPGLHGGEWAKIATFRGIGDAEDTRTIAGWVLMEAVNRAQQFERVTRWSGPRVLLAFAGDWGDTYYFDEYGGVYDSGGRGQLWKLENIWIGEMQNSLESFEVSSSRVCTLQFCSTTITRIPSTNGNLASNEADALSIAKSMTSALFERGQLPYQDVEPKVSEVGWQPTRGVYVFEVHPVEQNDRYVHIVVLRSGASAAFVTVDTDPK